MLYKVGLLVAVLMRCAQSQVFPNPIITSSFGQIEGTRPRSDVFVYLGLPYAEPMTNENRFKPAVEYQTPFDTQPYDATQHKNACSQNSAQLAIYLEEATTTDEGQALAQSVTPSEDCLYLNIYTPAAPSDAELYSVMLFIHGGDFNSGTGSAFKGQQLTRSNNVVVVTINYRLGAFGFLSNNTNTFSGNYGLMDQKIALRWVENHIHSFGGNASSITLFGEEAGGSSIHIHSLSSSFNKSFHNAIIQSAFYDDGVWTQQQCKDQFEEFLTDLGLSHTDSNLEASLQELFSAQIQTSSQKFTWRPCLHSSILEDSPENLLQTNTFGNDVNIIIGTNYDAVSGQSYNVTSELWLNTVTTDIVTSSFPQLYGLITSDEINMMSQNYFQFYSTASEHQLTESERQLFIGRAFTDQLYKTWVQEVSWKTSQRNNTSVYNYLFTSNRQIEVGSLSQELRYIFGYRTTLEEQALSRTMMTYWTNFAKSGNPNLPVQSTQVFTWPEFETYGDACRQSLSIGVELLELVAQEAVSRSWDFWTQYYDLLEFSCYNETDSLQDPTDVNPEEECEPTVKDAIGMNVTNEEAGIMLIVFISLTSLFLLVSILTSCFCCFYKKRLKKARKRNKNSRQGNDNPSLPEYKL